MSEKQHVKKAKVKCYVLILFVLVSVMFPRIITSFGFPKIINFLHFLFIIVLAFILLNEKKKLFDIIKFLIGLGILLALIILSAVFNNSGVVNAVLDFLLLAEPFLFLMAIVTISWSPINVKNFRFWILLIVFIHICMAFYQWFVLGLGNDDVRGVFLNMGAGCHLAGAVALTAAIYILFVYSDHPTLWRIVCAVVCSAVVVLSDSKQVIAVFLLSTAGLVLLRLNNIKRFMIYTSILLFFCTLVAIAAKTFFPALTVWAHADKISEGLGQKLSVFPIIISYYDSFFNWFVGMGPGHTVGRLGFMLPKYYQYVKPLGATISPITDAVWLAQQNHYISNSRTGSSVFSLFFSWAGVWGDLGLVGLAIYLYLWFFVWNKFCLDEISRFLLITIIVFGGVFSWMEEPGYMLFVMAIIGLRWQELHCQKLKPHNSHRNMSMKKRHPVR